MEEGTVVGIVSLGVTLIIAVAGFLYWRRKRKKVHFDVVWKHASALTPEEVMSYRGRKENGYGPYYYPRQVDDKIKELIRNKKNVVVLGKPLAGKTRSVYEALKSLDEPAVVAIPRMIDINPTEFAIPANIKMWKAKILLVDDVGKFIAKQNFTHVLREFVKRKTVIVATCWLDEWDAVKQKLEQEAGLHFGEPVTQEDITNDEAKDVATQAHKAVPKTFDGNIGSIFVDLDEMKRRYSKCSAEEKAFLRSVKRLYQAGVYEGREVFSLDKITAVGQKAEGVTEQQFHWAALVDNLTKKGFCTKEGEGLHFEEAHLQYVVEGDFEEVAAFQLLADLFSEDPHALSSICITAFDRGSEDRQVSAYLKLAIGLYDRVLKVWTLDNSPLDYAAVLGNLGNVYRSLAEVEDWEANCQHALKVFEQSLIVFTQQDFPLQYGQTWNGVGTVYATMADFKDKATNSKAAISSYLQCLQVISLESSPYLYAIVQSNLGDAYESLAEKENKSTNCLLAIEAFKEMLRVYTLGDSPVEHAQGLSSLGLAYSILGEVRDGASNCRTAIELHRDALNIFDCSRVPISCARTRTNLARAHVELAEIDVEVKALNAEIAVELLLEVLTVYTHETLPFQYAMTQHNLGNTYFTLAEVQDRQHNCLEAATAYLEAAAAFESMGLFPHCESSRDMYRKLAAFCEGVDESDS